MDIWGDDIPTRSDEIAVLLLQPIQQQVVLRGATVPHMKQLRYAHVERSIKPGLSQSVETDAIDNYAS